MTEIHRRRMWLELPSLRIHRDQIIAIALNRYAMSGQDERPFCFSVTIRKGNNDKLASAKVTFEESIELWKYIDEFLSEPPRGKIEPTV